MIPGLLLLMFFQPLCFFNPSVLRPPPLYLLRKTQGRSVIHVFLYSSMCFLYNNIKHSHLLPLYCCVTRQRESVRFDFVTVAVFSTPPSFGHLPYILLCKTQRRRGYLILLLSLFFNPSIFLTPYGHSPYMAVPHRGRGLKSGLFPYAVFAPRNAAGHGRGEVKISFR